MIDGVKYKVDPQDNSKALLDSEGKPIPYVEPTPSPAPNPSKKSLDDLAKEDPDVARLVAENKRLAEEQTERERKAEAERTEQLRKNGEFQKLADEAETRASNLKEKLSEANAIIDKYKGTVNEIRDEMVAQIPDDKKSLVPDGSAKSQIEYIRKNAKFLGVSLLTKMGSDVPPNKETPPLDEESKLRKEFHDLMAKGSLTQTEQNRLTELSKLLKKLTNK